MMTLALGYTLLACLPQQRRTFASWLAVPHMSRQPRNMPRPLQMWYANPCLAIGLSCGTRPAPRAISVSWRASSLANSQVRPTGPGNTPLIRLGSMLPSRSLIISRLSRPLVRQVLKCATDPYRGISCGARAAIPQSLSVAALTSRSLGRRLVCIAIRPPMDQSPPGPHCHCGRAC